MTTIRDIERAITRYRNTMIRRTGREPSGFRAKTLARILGVPTSTVSARLQDYRRAQRHGTTAYVIQGRSYGRDAEWRILTRPDGDTRVEQRDRKAAATYVASDAMARLVSDWLAEIRPSLRRSTAIDKLIGIYVEQLMELDQVVLAQLVKQIDALTT